MASPPKCHKGRLTHTDDPGKRPLAQAPPAAKCRNLVAKRWSGGEVLAAQREGQS